MCACVCCMLKKIESSGNESERMPTSSSDDNVVLDWKGDPMHINPGDKLPFDFKWCGHDLWLAVVCGFPCNSAQIVHPLRTFHVQNTPAQQGWPYMTEDSMVLFMKAYLLNMMKQWGISWQQLIMKKSKLSCHWGSGALCSWVLEQIEWTGVMLWWSQRSWSYRKGSEQQAHLFGKNWACPNRNSTGNCYKMYNNCFVPPFFSYFRNLSQCRHNVETLLLIDC